MAALSTPISFARNPMNMTTKPTSKRSAFLPTAVALCLFLNMFGATTASAAEPIDEVNVMIGTTGPSVYDYGGMIPGVTVPFGMTHWTARTRENKISVYSYNHRDATIRGFIGTHQPAIWMGDYGQVSLMPYSGELRTPEPQLPFRHEDETAAPNHYSVLMGEAGRQIAAELTATTRAGFLRFKFPASDASHVVVTACKSESEGVRGSVRVNAAAREIVGYNPDRMSAHLGPPLPNFKGYFVVQFDKPFASSGTWSGGEIFA